ncbi:hypothetical protein NDU88_007427 [Pleurodeles waltl]|uniref:Uncharacterized protein n=1 Tax=Pleurodeles waltl TaxID=8319 RepID=A0AAV7WFE5_PLEWA|nr:hypothetical protein NDU88_007427 [Pleurodeles waltl]
MTFRSLSSLSPRAPYTYFRSQLYANLGLAPPLMDTTRAHIAPLRGPALSLEPRPRGSCHFQPPSSHRQASSDSPAPRDGRSQSPYWAPPPMICFTPSHSLEGPVRRGSVTVISPALVQSFQLAPPFRAHRLARWQRLARCSCVRGPALP